MSPHSTRAALRLLGTPLRHLRSLWWAAAGTGTVVLTFGVAAWLALLGWFDPPYWVLVAWALAIGGALSGGVVAWRHRSALSDAALAQHLERQAPWRPGQLRALLERPAAGTSESLLAEADELEARSLVRDGATALRPMRRRLRYRAAGSGVLLGAGLLAFLTADPFDGSAAALWHPRAAWEATTAPVRIGLTQPVVNRGDSVEFLVEAVGRRRATLWTRAPGESWMPQRVALDSLGRGRVGSGPLFADVFARVVSGRRESDTVSVRVRLPAFLGALTLTARYPAYLGLHDEPLPVTGDTVLLPIGTRLEVRGEATAELDAVNWRAGSTRYPMDVEGGRFWGFLRPGTSGAYRLEVATASGAPLAGDTVVIPIRLVPDRAPEVAIPVPGRDTLAPLSLRLPLVIDVRDDYGLRTISLHLRRVSRFGLSDTLPVQPIPLTGSVTDRAILTHQLDLNGYGLLPGDTVHYFVEAVDNAPAAHVGRSREYLLRLPTMSEVRAAARAASEAVSSRLDSLAESSRKLERQTEDLSRERQRSGTEANGQGDETLSFEDAERAEAAAEAQRELLREVEALREAMEALRQSAQAAGLNDPEWQARLSEIRDQLDRALSPELRARLDELQRALQDLDADRTREALEDLAQAQQELREAIERSRELFRRAALEGDMANLAEEASELAGDQERWIDQMAESDSASAAAWEQQLADRADSLAAALEKLGQQLQAEAMQQALQDAAQQAAQAAAQMQQAADMAQAGDMSGARQQGQKGLQQLQPLGEQLQQQLDQLQQQWRQEVVAALDRGLAETARLLERQVLVEQSARSVVSPERQRAEQGAVEEGVEKLMERMRQLAGRNALVSPQIATALSAAKEHMRASREALSTAAVNEREAADRAGQGADALNAAAYLMLRSRGDVSGSGSGSGLTEAMERMSQLAQQQGQLSQQAGSLLPMIGQSGVQSELRRLGDGQRELAEELERLQAQGDVPQAGPLAAEARELARRLEAGRLDRETVRRQERLFRRLLDQGRTLQGQEEDQKQERKSRTPEAQDAALPPALRAQLPGSADRLRLPSWEELKRFSPEERRLVVEYFRRLTDAGTE